MAWMQRRVRGIETEYGLSLDQRLPGADAALQWRRAGTDEAARLLFRPITTTSATTNVFLRNGGRLYLDVGSHPEYATAECDDLGDLIAHDRAGDAVLNRLADRAIEHLADEGIEARVRLFKNNLDSHQNSYGSHENYQIGRWLGLRELAGSLTGFLVVRQLLCGAGSYVREGSGGRLWVSQRAAHMWDPVASSTTRTRPMINTRDEPHADPQRFRRLHVIVGDSTLAQPTTLVRVGSTELVLRAIEDGQRFDRLLPADPAAAIRDVAREGTGHTVVELAGGGTTTALDLLTELLEQVRGRADDPWLTQAVELWELVIEALADRRFELIDSQIDWAIKRRIMLGHAARSQSRVSEAKLAQIDLAYHDLRPGQGLFTRLEAAGEVATLVSEERIARAVDHPPGTTRAALRGRFIEAAQRHHRTHTADWMSLVARDLPDGTVLLPDPLVHDDPRVDGLIQRMGSEPRRTDSVHFTDSQPPV